MHVMKNWWTSCNQNLNEQNNLVSSRQFKKGKQNIYVKEFRLAK